MDEYAERSREDLLDEIQELKKQLLLLQNRPATFYPPEHDLSPFVEDHSEIIARLAPDGTILFMNPAGGLYFGTSFEELVTVNIDKIITPEYYEELKNLIALLSPENPVINCGKGLPALNETLRYKYWRIRGLFAQDKALIEVQLVGKDISEQELFENVLDQTRQDLHKEILQYRQAEQDYYELFDKANEIIYSHDFEGRLLFINKNGEKILGFEPGTLNGRPIYDIIVPENHQLVSDMIKLKLNNEQHTNYELPVLNSTGEIRTLELSSRLIYRDNQPYAIMGIARDITERKHMEDTLREGEAKFRKLAETSPAFILVAQGNHFKYVNPHFEKLTGYTQEELMQLNFWDMIHPEYRDLVRERGLARQQGVISISRYEFKINTKNGKEIWVDFSADLIEYEGHPAIIGTGYDISSKKELEHALKNSEENFRQLAETAPALIYVIQGSDLVYFNLETERVTGYSKEELVNMKNWEFIHPDHREWVNKITLARQRGEYAPNRYETIILNKNGESIWIEVAVSIINFNHQPASLGVGIDITERKKSMEQIKYLNYHDRLTGLYNRAFLEEQSKLLDDDKHLPLTVIMGDVNGLKMINDALGHQHGDRLLKIVADSLKSCCRANDILARWGGDEFVILLPQTDEKTAAGICSKINSVFNCQKEFPLQVSISLGICAKTEPQQELAEVSKEAEDRMYRNKLLESKSNRSLFIRSLEKTLWTRSHETQNHTERLRKLVSEIGNALALDSSELNNLTLLAALHDIGKIAIPNSILDKKDKLSFEEWEMMKKHPEIGYRIAMSSPELTAIAEGILTHHERWDGRGYPLGLEDDDIPLLSRIVAIADAYDVMLHGRPYQKKVTVDQALQEIQRCAGSQFDPNLAQLFINLIRKESRKSHVEVG